MAIADNRGHRSPLGAALRSPLGALGCCDCGCRVCHADAGPGQCHYRPSDRFNVAYTVTKGGVQYSKSEALKMTNGAFGYWYPERAESPCRGTDDMFQAALLWRWTDADVTPTDTDPNQIELALHCYDDGGAAATEPRGVVTVRRSGDHHVSTDNGDVTEVGSWTTRVGGWSDGVNQYLDDNNTGKGSKTITIRPANQTVFKGYAYTVRAYSPGGSFDTAAPWTIYHNGTSTSGTWDQSAAGWADLATVVFSGDTDDDERIEISNTGTTATVLADSFRIEGKVLFSVCLKGKDGDHPHDDTYQLYCNGTPGTLTSGMGSFLTEESVTSIDSLSITRSGTPTCCKECGVCCFDRLATITWSDQLIVDCYGADGTCTDPPSSTVTSTSNISHWPANAVALNSGPSSEVLAQFVSERITASPASTRYIWTQVRYDCSNDVWEYRYDSGGSHATLAAALSAGPPDPWPAWTTLAAGGADQSDCCGYSDDTTPGSCLPDQAACGGVGNFGKNHSEFDIVVSNNGCCRDATAETSWLCADDFNGSKAAADCACQQAVDEDCDGDCEGI